MTITCGFFNGSDRAANATDVCSIFDGLISDGIYDTIGTAFAVTAGGGNSLNLGAGRAWFNHTWTKNDATVVYEAPAAELLLHRWDRMVLEVDHSEAVRTNRIFVMTGTPSSTPVLPSLSAGPLKFQYSLAKIYRAAGSTSIAQIDITPEQGTVDTPFVNALIEKYDIATILSQFTERAEGMLDDWEAAYLLLQETGIPQHHQVHAAGSSDPIPPESIGAEKEHLSFLDQTISTSGWATYTAEAGEETKIKTKLFIYKKSLVLSGVLANMKVYVIPSEDVADCGTTINSKVIPRDGAIDIYAKGIPTAAFIFLSIDCAKAGG